MKYLIGVSEVGKLSFKALDKKLFVHIYIYLNITSHLKINI